MSLLSEICGWVIIILCVLMLGTLINWGYFRRIDIAIKIYAQLGYKIRVQHYLDLGNQITDYGQPTNYDPNRINVGLFESGHIAYFIGWY